MLLLSLNEIGVHQSSAPLPPIRQPACPLNPGGQSFYTHAILWWEIFTLEGMPMRDRGADTPPGQVRWMGVLGPDADFLIITAGGEHCRVGWVPGDGIDATVGVAFECFDQGAIVLVPNIDLRVCSERKISKVRVVWKCAADMSLPQLPLSTRPWSVPPNVLRMM